MEAIRKEPVYLSDLINPTFVTLCSNRIKETFRELIIKEPVNIENLPINERLFYLECIRPSYWTELNKSQRNRNKQRYNCLLENYSIDRLKDRTYNILVKTLENITAYNPKSLYLFTQTISSTLRPFDHLDNVSISRIPVYQVRKCLTCGRDISAQKETSKYCSQRLFGEEVKRCRNAASNPRNNFKRYLNNVTAKGILFDIVPFIKHTGNLHY